MSKIRYVPHRAGGRFTFGVKRYSLGKRPGWKVVRVAGGFWHLPPGIFNYYSLDQIQTFLNKADWQQRSSFDNIRCNELRKTKDALERGIYWTGQHSFQVGGFQDDCTVEEIVEEVNGRKYIGIRVSCPDNPDYGYVLVTDKDVTMATFYKYLLFYSRNIFFREDSNVDVWTIGFPYLRLRSQKACSTTTSKSIPKSSVLRLLSTTVTSMM